MRVLLCLISCLCVAQEIPLFTKDFTPEEFRARREKVFNAIGKDGLALLQGAPSPNAYTRFRQTNQFYYLSGIEVPHAYLLLDGATRKTTLYLPHRNERREAGEGKLLSAEDAALISSLTGLDEVQGSELMAERLARAAAQPRKLFTPMQPAEGYAGPRDMGHRSNADIASDAWDGRPSREGRFLTLLRERLPQLEFLNLEPVLDKLRVIKSPAEISLIRRATELSCEALLESMKATRPGMNEYELNALGTFVFLRGGAQGDAYYSLVASGGNAWFPHYNAGKRKMDSGELLLMDFAPDYHYYTSDVTRIWPVNGKFNEKQRELYGFYVGAYESILASIKPAVPLGTIMKNAIAEMDKILASSKFSKPSYQRAAEAFVDNFRKGPPRLGHWVGLAVHDSGPAMTQLEPGMVFVIEPALTVPEERIYIRMEDVMVVTENGVEVLSAKLPRKMEEIERVMKR